MFGPTTVIAGDSRAALLVRAGWTLASRAECLIIQEHSRTTAARVLLS